MITNIYRIYKRRLFTAAVFVAAAIACAAAPAMAADDAAQLATGKKLFLQTTVPPCAICHTLKDAGAAGEVGPVLDEIKPDAARVAKAVRDGIGAMPSFKTALSDEQIAAIAVYVAKASGGAK